MTRATLPDHVKVGQGDTTVYLLHGGYGSKDYWAPMIVRLARAGYRVIAWDAPGYGVSPLPERFSIEGAAGACAALIDDTGTQCNIVLGHSMGGLIAPLVAALRPDAVQAVVLSATVSSFGHLDAATRAEFVAERVAPLDAGKTMRDVAGPLVLSMMGPDASGADVDQIVEATAQTPDATFRAAIQAIVDYDGEPALSALTQPTLVIAGERDPIGRADNLQALARALPAATYHCIPGTGHYAWAEDPRGFDAALLPFLMRIAAPPAPSQTLA